MEKITLWEGNNIDGEFEATYSEILQAVKRCKKFMFFNEMLLRHVLADSEEFNATYNEADFQKLLKYIDNELKGK